MGRIPSNRGKPIDLMEAIRGPEFTLALRYSATRTPSGDLGIGNRCVSLSKKEMDTDVEEWR